MAQLVKHPSLDLSSGLGLRVIGSNPTQHGAHQKKKITFQSSSLAQKVEHVVLDLRVVSLSPMLGAEVT